MTGLIQSLKSPRRIALLAAALLGIVATVFIILQFNKRIDAEREQATASARVEVQESVLRPPSTDGVTAYLNSADVRTTVVFNNLRFLATSGGLIALDETGNLKKRYTTLDGLTDNDLTALAVFQNRLYIGTAANGLMSFDGNTFRSYRFTKPKATRVSVLLTTVTELLIGTLDGGLFEYNGEKFTRRLNGTTEADFERVTALLQNDSRLYIGTQDKGLYLWREAHIEHLSTQEGLPSPHITGLAVEPVSQSIAVATDFGAVTLNEANEVKELSQQPNITSLAASRGRLWAGLFNGGIAELSKAEKSPATGFPDKVATTVFAEDDKLWALTQQGAFVRDESSSRTAFEPLAGIGGGERILSAAHITTLASDTQGRLWIGYFDKGIDVLALESGERLSHIEDDRVREINFLAFDRANDRILIATSRGLISLDSRANQSLLTKEQGLIDNAVAHISLVEDAMGRGERLVLATAGGLTEITQGRARSLTAFHGLSSNHLYTSAGNSSRLFVGSLSGLVELEGLRVIRVYKKSNSKLSDDWVTALQEIDGTLYIGTNGGGVDALLPTGEWVNFSDEQGKFEVNPNAMYFDGERLYIGTSDKGLFAYNVRERRWSRISASLTSQNVTAITSDDRFIYVGTLNGLVRIEKRVIG